MTGEYQEKVLSETVQVVSPDVRATPTSSEQQGPAQFDPSNQDNMESGAMEAKHTVVTEDVDPLDEFLPPPPATNCSPELQVRNLSTLYADF